MARLLAALVLVCAGVGTVWGGEPGNLGATVAQLQAKADAQPNSVGAWTQLALTLAYNGRQAEAITALHGVMGRVLLSGTM